MAATTVVSRENIELWTPDSPKLYWFRRALEGMQAISAAGRMDESGYQWVAGVHGGFGGQPYCEHGTLNFVTWHRPYVLDFELKVRDQISKLADAATAAEWRLPYWDWAAPNVPGMPAAFTDPTYDDHGTTKPNPLLAMPYDLPYDPGLGVDPWPTMTFRQPLSIAELQALRPLVDKALKEPDFSTFSKAIERPHNSLHTWVLGYMATYRSSFDPIFWVHHCNIDRQFWTWQQSFGNSSIPASVHDFTCQPFQFRDNQGGAFFDTRALGYTYAASRRLVTRPVAFERLAAFRALDGTLPETLTIDMGRIDHDFARAKIHFHGLEHTSRSYEIRVFANCQDTPTGDTPKTSAAHFLGAYVILGHGKCPGAPGHCDRKAKVADGLRRDHHLAPFDTFIDVSEGLQRLAGAYPAGPGVGPLTMSFVVVDAMTRAQVPSDVIEFDNISLTTH